MKKKIAALAILLGAMTLFGCGKSKNTQDDINSVVQEEVSIEVEESRKNNDITVAKSIKTAVETALGNEDMYMEITGDHANQLISVTEQGLNVLETTTKDEILKNIGENIPVVKYTELGADHFAFIVDKTGAVTVYVCNVNNSTKWMLTPDIDMEYGGTVNTELIGVEQPGAMADTDVELESAQKSNDVTGAKSIKTAVETILGNEEMYEEMTGNHAGELIVVTDTGLDVLGENIKSELILNMGKLPEVMYMENGASHFAFVVDDKGMVTVYVCTEDNSTKWNLCPNLDVEYGGEEITTEVDEQTEDLTSEE